jgi:predicted metal-dependent enzyme (double-stranded beta helix superfamily)
MNDLSRLTGFVKDFTALIDEVDDDEARILESGERLLADLIAHDDWLPDACAAPHPDHYQQYLLHCDPGERFSLVSFVWGPGHTTPIHDHTVWGLVGILRGRERVTDLVLTGEGEPPARENEHLCVPGDVDRVSPTIGDIHEVANADPDDPSISIHVYGANIGRVARHVFDPETGEKKAFVSGYSNETIPNIWNS